MRRPAPETAPRGAGSRTVQAPCACLSIPCSGRCGRGSASYWGPPTAPHSTASAACASFERGFRQRVAVGVHARAAERSVLQFELQAIARQCFEDLDRLRDDLRADAVTGQYRDFHVRSREEGRENGKDNSANHDKTRFSLHPSPFPRRTARAARSPVLRLERLDLFGVLQREADLVEPVQQVQCLANGSMSNLIAFAAPASLRSAARDPQPAGSLPSACTSRNRRSTIFSSSLITRSPFLRLLL